MTATGDERCSCVAEPAAGHEPGLLSVVIPCFNEIAVLGLLHARLVSALDGLDMPWEVVFVDDGSSDGSYQRLVGWHAEDPRFSVVRFSRNFGHQAAVMAGLSHVRGEVVAVLDADLQDPPELLRDCLGHWRQGDDVVYCQRAQRQESVLMRLLYAGFYRLLRVFSEIEMPLDAGDFCLMDRKVVDAILSMRERRVFVRGLRAWAGFRQRALPYDRPGRAAGETKYGFWRLLKLATDGLFSFTLIPLRIATLLGFLLTLSCLAWGGFVVVWRLSGFRIFGHTAADLPGWAAGVLLVIVFGGFQLVFLGILGEYVGRIYEESKGRPRWVVQAAHDCGGRIRPRAGAVLPSPRCRAEDAGAAPARPASGS